MSSLSLQYASEKCEADGGHMEKCASLGIAGDAEVLTVRVLVFFTLWTVP